MLSLFKSKFMIKQIVQPFVWSWNVGSVDEFLFQNQDTSDNQVFKHPPVHWCFINCSHELAIKLLWHWFDSLLLQGVFISPELAASLVIHNTLSCLRKESSFRCSWTSKWRPEEKLSNLFRTCADIKKRCWRDVYILSRTRQWTSKSGPILVLIWPFLVHP